MTKILILFKLRKPNVLSKLVEQYANKYENVDSYFVMCDPTINENIELIKEDKLIKVKLIDNNKETLLIKIIEAFTFFKDLEYTHVLITNISTFINIPALYNEAKNSNSKCMSTDNVYRKIHGNKIQCPAGAGCLFDINTMKKLYYFFKNNNYIINNKLTKNLQKHIR